MKLDEIFSFYKNASDAVLKEYVEKHNDTGLLTEDVVKIIRNSQDETAWSEPMTGDQFLEHIQKLTKKNV